ncbi:universal stress protein [Streptomyces sp. NPDC046942]|uniref:universal stress protein n=1 Tax=Streptomyces sp. NPDC046942 TaxID=3155137 RepID=UPI0033F7BC27
MRKASAGRVIVGVDSSPAGLGALRAAVAQARLSGRELIAVRAYEPPPHRSATGQRQSMWWQAQLPDPEVSPSWHRLQAAREQEAIRSLEQAFAQATGGIPHGVRVRSVAAMGAPGEVLVAAAYLDDDLLVMGKPDVRKPRRIWPWRWFRRSTCRYCSAHAICPVLTVPPQGLPRLAGTGGRPLHSQATEDVSDATRCPPEERAFAGNTGMVTVWPERACCCSAPPMVKAIMPARGHHAVDLFLCGHHYRASLGPLVLADAMVTFRERLSVLTLAGHP